jgi:hypothetical protein
MTLEQAIYLLESIERYNTGSLRSERREYKAEAWQLLRSVAAEHAPGNDPYTDTLVALGIARIDALLAAV